MTTVADTLRNFLHLVTLDRCTQHAQSAQVYPNRPRPVDGSNGRWRALRPEERRVNFTDLEQVYEREGHRIASALGLGMLEVVAAIRKAALRPGTLRDPTAIRGLSISGRKMATARQQFEDILRTAYARGLSGAGQEIGGSRVATRLVEAVSDEATRYARRGPGLVGAKARAFLRSKTFFATGILQDDALAKAQATLFQALKGDKSERQIAFELDQALGTFVPTRDAAGRVVNLPARLETIARTNLAEAVNEGRWALFSDPEVQDVLAGVQYSAILDDRVRENHAAWDGVTRPVDDPVWFGPPDRRPPNGFNSFVGGTRVAGLVEAGSKARYAGPVVEIETREGRRLTVTPNHPILTPRGFVAAHRLRETDDMIVHRPSVRALEARAREWGVPSPAIPRWAVNDQEMPPRIEDVFEAFLRHATSTTPRSRARTTSLDFHGDAVGYQGYVDIVGADGLLPDNILPPQSELMYDGIFEPRRGTTALLAPARMPQSRMLRAVRLGRASRLYAPIHEPAADGTATDGALLCQLHLADPGQIALDKVVRIKRKAYVGHVYDLQSPNGWIVAEGVVSGNCRCTMVPVLAGETDMTPDSEIPAVEVSDDGFE